MGEKHLHTNRLIGEKSPYLLQHAHNPVDWYPWGEEAFNAAKEQDKPIFLSIGYATCHWCHVMEKESFENPEIAQLLNETFINIKVDREELPEVDNLYMEFAQSMMAGSAGWPLNVIITPTLEPFFAATYLPPYASHGMMGLNDVIMRILEVWQGEERERILRQASRIVEVFEENIHVSGDQIPPKELIDETGEMFFKLADPIYGGLKGTPKFPIGYQCNFFLRFSSRSQDGRALFLVERTLDMMQRGGIYDHLGGGISRYSVDEEWFVPHFEKMLYDNALIAHSYLETWQVTKKPLYRAICDEILDYILRDMTHPEGGFYSAEDADSEGHEGYFYTWELEEVRKIIGKEDNFELFCEFYDIIPEGNFEGRNILHTTLRIDEFAGKHQQDPIALENSFYAMKQTLWEARELRPHPFKDDKILSGWNGLMIFSLAEAGMAFEEPKLFQAAKKAALFIRNNLWNQGHLLRRWRLGEANFAASLDDYAYLIRGLLSLFEGEGDSQWLAWAMEMTDILQLQFKEEYGAFYQTDGNDEYLLLRKGQFSDGAEPSANAIHTENLLRLYHLTFDNKYLEQAEDILKAVKGYLDNYAPAYTYHMMNLDYYYDKQAPTFILALNEKEEHLKEVRLSVYSNFIPHRSLIIKNIKDNNTANLIPAVESYIPVNGKTTLYICHQGVCQKPITDLDEMLKAINKQ